jgi:hypothetical protein
MLYLKDKGDLSQERKYRGIELSIRTRVLRDNLLTEN